MARAAPDLLVLTACPQTANLTPRLCAQLARAFGLGAARILGENVAAEFDAPAKLDLPALRAKLAAQRVDANLVAAQNRRKGLLIADMESTIIEQECLDELADYLGRRDAIAAITRRAMQGEMDFAAALAARVKLLAGLPQAKLAELYDQRVTLMAGAPELVATMAAAGATCALVSGGFAYFAEKIAARLGFHRWRANQLALKDGKIAGTLTPPLLDRAAKRRFLLAWRDELNLAATATLAVGDGANDLDMLAEAGLGVAFRAKPQTAARARVNIHFGDLTALLYLQGYRRADFASCAERDKA